MVGHKMHSQMNVKQRHYLKAIVDISRRQTTEEGKKEKEKKKEEEKKESK